jgi:hypothetical protein
MRYIYCDCNRRSYINAVAQRTRRIGISKDGKEARHGLQTTDSCSVNAILHVGDRDDAAKHEAFLVRP